MNTYIFAAEAANMGRRMVRRVRAEYLADALTILLRRHPLTIMADWKIVSIRRKSFSPRSSFWNMSVHANLKGESI